MAFYQKIPLVIEAEQLVKENFAVVRRFLREGGCDNFVEYKAKPIHWEIPTPQGTVCALEGDFITKDINGEFCSCKSDFFEESYELAPTLDEEDPVISDPPDDSEQPTDYEEGVGILAEFDDAANSAIQTEPDPEG